MSNPTKKKITAILGVLMVVLLMMPLLATVMSGSASAAVSKAELNKLKTQAASLSKESKKIAAELKDIRNDKASAIKEKSYIDKQITVLQKEVETTKLIIQNLSEQIAQKEIEVTDAEAKEIDEYDLFKKRVRAMEENGSASYWGVLLKVETFSELLTKAEVINEIMEYDRALMSDLKTMRERIEADKAELETNKAEQDASKTDLESQVAELEDKYEAQNSFIKSLEQNEEAYVAAYEEALEEMERVNKEVTKMAAELAKQSAYVGGVYTWPLPGHSTITSEYGNRRHPILKKYTFHSGVDIGAPSGSSIVAANDGKVIISGWNNAYGNYIVISHGGGQTTLYAHMSKLIAHKNDTVKKGEKIGLVGSTGWSTGPHLHFEISINGKTVNPMNYFSKK